MNSYVICGINTDNTNTVYMIWLQCLLILDLLLSSMTLTLIVLAYGLSLSLFILISYVLLLYLSVLISALWRLIKAYVILK